MLQTLHLYVQFYVMSVTKKWQNQKWEIGNRPEPHLDKFNSSDNLTYQESINKQKHSLWNSHISCSELIGVKNSSVTDITDSFRYMHYSRNKKYQ